MNRRSWSLTVIAISVQAAAQLAQPTTPAPPGAKPSSTTETEASAQAVFDAIVFESLHHPIDSVNAKQEARKAELAARVAANPLAFLPVIERILALPDPETMEVPSRDENANDRSSPFRKRRFEAHAAAKLLKYLPADKRDALMASHFDKELESSNRLDDRYYEEQKVWRAAGSIQPISPLMHSLGFRARWLDDRCTDLILAAEETVSPVLIEPVFRMLEDSRHDGPSSEYATRYLESFPARYTEFRERLNAILVKLPHRQNTRKHYIEKAIEWMTPRVPNFPAKPAAK